MVAIGSIWLRIGNGGGLMWTRWWTSGFHKMLGSSRVAAQLAAPWVSEWVRLCNCFGTCTCMSQRMKKEIAWLRYVKISVATLQMTRLFRSHFIFWCDSVLLWIASTSLTVWNYIRSYEVRTSYPTVLISLQCVYIRFVEVPLSVVIINKRIVCILLSTPDSFFVLNQICSPKLKIP
jgi:hypothetical protein